MINESISIKMYENLRLNDNYHIIDSKDTDTYNCIAWSLGYTDKTIWPVKDDIRWIWPNDIPYNTSRESFLELYRREGFIICDNPYHLNQFYDVVALYMKKYINVFHITHAAKLISNNGYWSS